MKSSHTPTAGTTTADTPEVQACRGRPRGFCRDQALRRAMRLFWAHGYEGVSVAQLTKELCIAPPSLYAAFGSKEALYREALDLYLRENADLFAASLAMVPARAGILALLRELAVRYASGEQPPGCMVVAAGVACAQEQRGVAEDLAARRTHLLDALAERFEKARAAGELRPDADCRALARLVVATLQGMSIQARDGATEAELLSLVDAAMAGWPEPVGRMEAEP
ncbi:MAG TPA: TetR/AcrR family transcriptional regulator [Azospirillaceae bacterium]|nr:TetR/AcrR family transcriptional regulator [Azospirillaceae bacterium]